MAFRTSGSNSAFTNYNNEFSHIEGPNECRRLALAQIENAPFGWRHARAVVVAGVCFFAGSYGIFAITSLFGYAWFYLLASFCFTFWENFLQL
jgi:PHS family inorganic phosphate transporter-like MFS transporter